MTHKDIDVIPLKQSPSPEVRGNPIPERVSLNFSVAKVLAIFVVAFGHFCGAVMPNVPLWIPVTFGLIVFGFSSGYFTSLIYGDRVDRASFWRKKLERLALRYWVILVFITLVVAFKGQTVLHWHTLVHVFGMSGVLNWLGIRNYSALGAGLWFFTLLLLFYVTYPYLARMARSTLISALMLVAGFAAAIVLEANIPVGHMLWVTAYGFVAGVVFGAQAIRVPAWMSLIATAVLCALMLLLNLRGIKAWNLVLLTASGLTISMLLIAGRVPDSAITRYIVKLEKYVLEIFLIHMYLFVRPTGHWAVDYLATMMLVLAASVIVSKIAEALGRVVFARSRQVVSQVKAG